MLPRENRLYLICDGETCLKHGITIEDFCQAAFEGGARIIQYRHKGISAIEYEKNLTRLLPLSAHLALLANDHALIAAQHGLAVHLGQEDPLPQGVMLRYGRSTHSLDELEWALSATPPPGYIALGAMFPSRTKPDVAIHRELIPQYLQRMQLPLVLIGGITLDNIHELPAEDRIYYAIVSDAFRYGNTKAAIRRYVRKLIATLPRALPDIKQGKEVSL
ncbi:MAG: thiamine phosphate synthase [Turneriella sp.]|nr:thiamine phosphate synthase [Turneriella sp.]